MKKQVILFIVMCLSCTGCVSDYLYEHHPDNYYFNYVKAIFGRPEGQYRLARHLYNQGDMERCYKWCERAAENGQPNAQYQMGIAYEFADGLELDLDKAIYWYEQAASNGYPDAAAQLEKAKQKKSQQ